ncbi:MAG: hypothetical protein ABIJ50_01770 [Pseudomonadota bacterium]
MSSSYSWGVWGGYSFQLTCAPSGATLSGITINGPTNVNESSTATYTATANWSDGSTTTVTPSWSENSTYTTISSDGVLTTSSVTANQIVTVSASYTYGGATKTGAYIITVVDVPAAPALGEAVDNTSLTWETSGNSNWLGQTTTVYYGGDAAQSGDIADSQQSDIQTIVTGPGTLSFYWKVSSEKDWDYLRFSIDGTIQSGSISGIVDWTQKSFTIPAGSHILKWSYTKDGSASSNDDSGWLDKVEWKSTPTVTATLSVNATGSGTIISSPEGVNCGTACSNNFILNTEITLTAIPAEGGTFIGWLGDGCSGTEECIVIMDTNKEITAIFKKKFPWLMFLPTITNGIQ